MSKVEQPSATGTDRTVVGPSDAPAATRAAGSQRMSYGLVALSSAVVLAVYAAGYVKTQAAADRFAAEAGQRRPVLPAPAPVVEPPAAQPVVADPPPAAAPELAAIEPAPRPTAPAVPAAIAPVQPVPVAAPEALADPPPIASTPAASATATATAPPAATIAAASATAAAGVPAAPEAIVPAPVATPPAPVQAAAAPVPVPPAGPRYKDGTFTGWGTSRHGDIQAQVIVANGRITSATIVQCMTRWPCSWIEALPGQVVSRQSPETDFVSGATQSTNAFYYAVVQALGKAAIE